MDNKILKEFKKICGKRQVYYLEVLCVNHSEKYTIKKNHYTQGTRSCSGCLSERQVVNIDVRRHLESLVDTQPTYLFCFEGGSVIKYTCSKCSADEYVKRGLCSGVFKGNLTHLKNGKKGCRCSSRIKHTKESLQYKVDLLIEDNPTILRATIERYRTAVDSVIVATCATHGDFTATVNNFINHGSRCGGCTSTYGYYKGRVNESDHLYLLYAPSQGWYKIGRSFDVPRRLRTLNRASGVEWFIIDILNSSHKKIFHKEQAYLKRTYEDRVVGLNFSGCSEVRRFKRKIDAFYHLDKYLEDNKI